MIGKLDRRVYFIQAVIEQGDSNEDKITGWELITNNPVRWAQKIESRGNTVVISDALSIDKQTNWVIRYDENFESRNVGNIQHFRLVYETQMYQIVSISEVNDNRKRYMSLITQVLDKEFYS